MRGTRSAATHEPQPLVGPWGSPLAPTQDAQEGRTRERAGRSAQAGREGVQEPQGSRRAGAAGDAQAQEGRSRGTPEERRARMPLMLLVGSCADCGASGLEQDLVPVGSDHLSFFEGDELCQSCADEHGVL